MQCVHPDIARLIKLPSGTQLPTEYMPSMKWEYAIAMDDKLKHMEQLVETRHLPHELRNMVQKFYDDFRHAIGMINYQSGEFEAIFKTALPEHFNSSKVSKQFVQTMRAALEEDVGKFGEFPAHFASLKLFMDHEARKMAQDMEMEAYNGFEKLGKLHETYLHYKLRGGHGYAVASLKNNSPQYWDMVKHLTLLDRIDKLEAENKALHTQTEVAFLSLLERIDALEERVKASEAK